ncbi:hypothetical protein RRG08_067251, partial [Elysia crispata]
KAAGIDSSILHHKELELYHDEDLSPLDLDNGRRYNGSSAM